MSHDANRQRGILDALFPLLKRGGTLVYSTCSLEQEENEEVAENAAREIPGIVLAEMHRREPHRDGIDGAFAARFVRAL